MSATYTLISGKHSRFEDGELVSYRKGETLVLSDAEASGASLAGRIERLPLPPPQRDPSDRPPTPPPDRVAGGIAAERAPEWANALSGNLGDFRELVTRLTGQPEALRDLAERERAGQNRKGALAAIEEALA